MTKKFFYPVKVTSHLNRLCSKGMPGGGDYIRMGKIKQKKEDADRV